MLEMSESRAKTRAKYHLEYLPLGNHGEPQYETGSLKSTNRQLHFFIMYERCYPLRKWVQNFELRLYLGLEFT